MAEPSEFTWFYFRFIAFFLVSWVSTASVQVFYFVWLKELPILIRQNHPYLDKMNKKCGYLYYGSWMQRFREYFVNCSDMFLCQLFTDLQSDWHARLALPPAGLPLPASPRRQTQTAPLTSQISFGRGPTRAPEVIPKSKFVSIPG